MMPSHRRKFVPLSVRTGNRRTRAAWKWKGVKERFALWLCPWLRGAVENAGQEIVNEGEEEPVVYYRIMAPGDPYKRRFPSFAAADEIKRSLKRPGCAVLAFNATGKVVES